jgi:hypothetical protein
LLCTRPHWIPDSAADRAAREIAIVDGTPSTCPLCGCGPAVGVLRSEGDGAKKSLICVLCAHEWAFRRIYCPACGEEREPQMAYYSAPEIAHVRVDVCDSCYTYLKSISADGLAQCATGAVGTYEVWAVAERGGDSCGTAGLVPANPCGGAGSCQVTGTAQMKVPIALQKVSSFLGVARRTPVPSIVAKSLFHSLRVNERKRIRVCHSVY